MKKNPFFKKPTTNSEELIKKEDLKITELMPERKNALEDLDEMGSIYFKRSKIFEKMK